MLSERELFMAVISGDALVKSDVIVLLEGDGTSRLEYAAWLFNNGYAPKICFSGGATNIPYGSYPFEYYKPRLKEFGLTENDFILEQTSQHTQQQAEEVVKLAEKYNWNKLLLVASHYHQYRAYLTFLKEILLKNKDIILINAPAKDISWFSNNDWGQRYDLLSPEFEKIEKYLQSGHCATYGEAIEYQKWKEKRLSRK
jgi:uncharacterized SAM-binding protein YcdF (DUF218 family)